MNFVELGGFVNFFFPVDYLYKLQFFTQRKIDKKYFLEQAQSKSRKNSNSLKARYIKMSKISSPFSEVTISVKKKASG